MAWSANNTLDWDAGDDSRLLNGTNAHSSHHPHHHHDAADAVPPSRAHGTSSFTDHSASNSSSSSPNSTTHSLSDSKGDSLDSVSIKINEGPVLGINSTSAIVAQIISSSPDPADPNSSSPPSLERTLAELVKEDGELRALASQRVPFHQIFLEFIGTYVLTWFALVIGLNTDRMPFLGFASAVLTYLCGHISGGHFNPAVTLAVLIRGKMNRKLAMFYILAQVLGSIIGSLMTWGWFVHSGISESLHFTPIHLAPHPAFGRFDITFVEFFYTTILCYLFLTLTSTRANQDNDHYEFILGIYYSCAIAVTCNISRGYLNPALSIGLSISSTLDDGPGAASGIWMYLLSELTAPIVVGLWFRIINRKDKDHSLMPPLGRNQNVHMQGTAQ